MFLLTLFADRGALKWTDQDEKTENIPLVNRDHNDGRKMEDDLMTCRSVDFNDKVKVVLCFQYSRTLLKRVAKRTYQSVLKVTQKAA